MGGFEALSVNTLKFIRYFIHHICNGGKFMFYVSFDKIGRYKYRWPAGIEEYDGIHYNAEINGTKVPIIVGFTKKEAFGKPRKKIIVFIKDQPIVEFAETDNYEKTGLVIGVLKKPRSEEMYKINDELPSELEKFKLVYHKDYIQDGFDRIGILLSSSDIQGMIEYALTKARLEGNI